MLLACQARQSFKAIKNVRGWWSEEIEGPTDTVGDVFEYDYKDLHRCTMKTTPMPPSPTCARISYGPSLSPGASMGPASYRTSHEHSTTEVRVLRLADTVWT